MKKKPISLETFAELSSRKVREEILSLFALDETPLDIAKAFEKREDFDSAAQYFVESGNTAEMKGFYERCLNTFTRKDSYREYFFKKSFQVILSEVRGGEYIQNIHSVVEDIFEDHRARTESSENSVVDQDFHSFFSVARSVGIEKSLAEQLLDGYDPALSFAHFCAERERRDPEGVHEASSDSERLERLRQNLTIRDICECDMRTEVPLSYERGTDLFFEYLHPESTPEEKITLLLADSSQRFPRSDRDAENITENLIVSAREIAEENGLEKHFFRQCYSLSPGHAISYFEKTMNPELLQDLRPEMIKVIPTLLGYFDKAPMSKKKKKDYVGNLIDQYIHSDHFCPGSYSSVKRLAELAEKYHTNPSLRRRFYEGERHVSFSQCARMATKEGKKEVTSVYRAVVRQETNRENEKRKELLRAELKRLR